MNLSVQKAGLDMLTPFQASYGEVSYVASKTLLKLDWSNATLLQGDVVQEMKIEPVRDGS